MNKKDRFRYLVKRIQTFTVVLIGSFIVLLCVDSGFQISEKMLFILALIVLEGISVWGYCWIVKPYRRIVAQMQRFSDGYISLVDLNELKVSVSPETERMINHINEIVEATRTLDMSKRQAQYRALQNQINPHFLYNTLEGIRSEALIEGLDSLADMTESLAVFFRYTISKVENLVTVEEELENCKTYFKIQQYRFGTRIHLIIEKEEEDWDEILHCLIPKLTLQPILENSIIHGVELKMDEGTVCISVSRTESRLLIRISDDGVGMKEEVLRKLNAKLGSKEEELKNYTHSEKQGGVALTNVNNRIHLIFGEEYGMHVFSMENVGTSIELSIPAVTNENELKKQTEHS